MNKINYLLDDKKIELASDTIVKIRNATISEKQECEKQHESTTPDFKFQVRLWTELCNTINNLKRRADHYVFEGHINEVRRIVLLSLGIKMVYYRQSINQFADGDSVYWHDDETTIKDEFEGCDAEIKLRDCNLQLVSNNIQVEIIYKIYHRVPDGFSERDGFIEPKQLYRTNEYKVYRLVECTYYKDFTNLILCLKAYINHVTKPKKKMFSNTFKEPKLSADVISLQGFLKRNSSQIEQFIHYSDTQKEKTEEIEDIYEVLQVNDNIYFAKDCNFDIHIKHDEMRKIITKITNSQDEGESDVDYALKWSLAELKSKISIVERDCESKYRYGCILLQDLDFINEPQEYDHILVSNAGVVLIETKNWKGKVEIRSDGKWTRDKNHDGNFCGVESPSFQMMRHEALIKNILPNVPVFSLLCFSNNSAIIEGRENFTNYPIVYPEQLKETLSKIINNTNKTENDINYIMQKIELHKINKY